VALLLGGVTPIIPMIFTGMADPLAQGRTLADAHVTVKSGAVAFGIGQRQQSARLRRGCPIVGAKLSSLSPTHAALLIQSGHRRHHHP
jgi:hypothetical protein